MIPNDFRCPISFMVKTTIPQITYFLKDNKILYIEKVNIIDIGMDMTHKWQK